MNQRFISVLIFAFVVAGCASLLLYRLTTNHGSAQAAPPTTKALLASRNLELGVIIKDSDVKDTPWLGSLPATAVLKREDIIGRGVTTTIYDGEPILENRLAPKGAGGGLAAMIPSGMRAVAVRVNDVVGVAGFVVPGMRVDVLISGNPPNPGAASQGSLTRTLLQNIEVLSAGQDFKKDNEGKPLGVGVVNLLVTPEQAEMLSLASNQTIIQLVLRNPLDTQMAKTPGTAVVELFAVNGPKKRPDPQKVYVRAAPKPAPPSAPVEVRQAPPVRQSFVMEVINGGKRSETKFDTTPEVK
ncbi:MAG: Flp pilus assembly protein CpaB [Bryobacteraceae bacterium]|jgi:pilus assembly protein CpaB